MAFHFLYQALQGSQPGSLPLLPMRSKPERRCGPVCHHWLAHAASLTSIICLLTILVSVLYSDSHESLTARCWHQHHFNSPMDDGLAETPYVTTRFNGSLWHKTQFKGPPTPDVEKAWYDAMKYGTISVTADDYLEAGHSLRTAVKFPPDAGGGYMATAMGTHQLHCLHFVWQDHHRDYFPDILRKAHDQPDLFERHYEHCIDIIRQSIMCNFDTTLLTFDWVLDHQNPTPNTNAMHKCVDWDAVQRWLRRRVVEMPRGFNWTQPEGQESLPWNP